MNSSRLTVFYEDTQQLLFRLAQFYGLTIFAELHPLKVKLEPVNLHTGCFRGHSPAQLGVHPCP